MYYIVYSVFYLFSLLPWRVIYCISDIISFLLYYVLRYRKAVVMANLLQAFPEKTEKERIRIAKDFYIGFVDNFIEAIKFISISKKEINKRFIGDYTFLDDLAEKNPHIQVNLGHFFSWEFSNIAYSANVKCRLVVVYMPIANKIFDKLFYDIRSRFGSKLISATNFRNEFAPYSKGQYALILTADQSPGSPDNTYWTNFLGKLTPFVKGPEKGAQLNRAAVAMGRVYKVKRGYYKSEFKLLTTDARSLSNGEITKQMVAFFEETIREHPADYLWSHRRWKWSYDETKHKHLLID